MYSVARIVTKYINYFFTGSNGKGHGTHSPSIFSFIKEVLADQQRYDDYKLLERERRKLLADHTTIHITDMGAGTVAGPVGKRSISRIARRSMKHRKYAQLLHRIVQFYKPNEIIELGTSLGITTAYMAKANPAARITTIEGSREIADRAESLFRKLQFSILSPRK